MKKGSFSDFEALVPLRAGGIDLTFFEPSIKTIRRDTRCVRDSGKSDAIVYQIGELPGINPKTACTFTWPLVPVKTGNDLSIVRDRLDVLSAPFKSGG